MMLIFTQLFDDFQAGRLIFPGFEFPGKREKYLFIPGKFLVFEKVIKSMFSLYLLCFSSFKFIELAQYY